MQFRLTCLAALALTILSGCAANDPTGPAPTPTSPAATVSPTPAGIRVDWAKPEAATLPGGWALSNCEGNAPLLCVALDTKPVGQLEVLAFDLATLPELADALAKRGEAAALREHATRYLDDFGKERAAGCGAGYRFTRDDPRELTSDAGPTVRYGFTGTLADGRPSEKIVQYAGVRSGQLVILSATAADDGGCLPAEGQYFTSAQLASFAPVLDQIMAVSPLPPADLS